ncbi:MAG: AAA family ATPase, partial [Elusimicrobia bacterium]|nr:AAA family ATPase [Elusimicrobiota bacterium]
MSYLVLARKFRPTTFDEVIGQDHISQTLKNAIKEDKVAHAYLFSGPRGTGKTTMARIFAKALNCKEGPTPEPCGKCQNCVDIAKNQSIDVMEIDAASNTGVD